MARPKGHKQGELTPKQRLFCKQYGEKNSKTYGNGVRSYIAAGYKDGKGAQVSSSKLLTNPMIVKELTKYSLTNSDNIVKNAEIKREYALTTHQELYDRCFADHDNTSCVALLRMYWQGAGLLSERLVIDVNDSRKLSEDYTKEAKRIAAIITNTGDLPALTHGDGIVGNSVVTANTLEAQFAVIPDAVEEDQEAQEQSDKDEKRYSALKAASSIDTVLSGSDSGLTPTIYSGDNNDTEAITRPESVPGQQVI